MLRCSRFVGYTVLLVALLSLPEAASAQAKRGVPINVVYGGVARLYDDLDYVFGLANDAKQLDKLKSTLEVFFVGLDRQKPAVIQVYVRRGKFNQVLHVPAANPSKFTANVRTLGLKTRLLNPKVFQVFGLFDGFLREVPSTPGQDSMVIIAEAREDLTPLGDIKLFKNKLDPKDNDLVISVVNTAQLLKDREDAVELVRQQVTPGLKQLKQETPGEFALRKLTTDQQISEIKQIYAEAEFITGVGNISKANRKAVFQIELKALPKTALAESISAMGQEPGYFANIPLSNTEPLSGVLNLKLDSMRQQHLLAFSNLARPLIQKEVSEADAISPELKAYAPIVTDILFDVLNQSTASGALDSFVNVRANASKLHTIVGGVKGDGAIVRKGLMKLKEKADDKKKLVVELDMKKVGDFALHQVTLPGNLPELEAIFGKKLTVTVATGPRAIWFAMGQDAATQLAEAMAKTEQPASMPTNTIASLHAEALIWYRLFDAFRFKNKKGDAELRREAIDALKKGDDIFDFKLQLDKDKLKSNLNLNEGMLRYVGKVAARYVKELPE